MRNSDPMALVPKTLKACVTNHEMGVRPQQAQATLRSFVGAVGVDVVSISPVLKEAKGTSVTRVLPYQIPSEGQTLDVVFQVMMHQ